MKIRQATEKDILDIQRLYHQLDEHHVRLLPEVFQSVEPDARPDALITGWLEDRDTAYLLAEQDGQVVGFVSVRQASNPAYPMFRPRDFAFIDNAVVDEAHRGRGIGKVLFEAAMDWALDRGLRHVQTTVWHDNAGAREFYLAQGFRPLTMRLEWTSGG